jgi:hypothetical protein
VRPRPAGGARAGGASDRLGRARRQRRPARGRPRLPRAGAAGRARPGPRGALRPVARPRPAVRRRAARAGVRRRQDVRRRAPAARAGRDRVALPRGAGVRRVRAARVRRLAVRGARRRRRRRGRRGGAEHGGAHPRPLAGAHARPRPTRPAVVAHPAPLRVRGAGRALPRGVLLGLVLHDARPRGERARRDGAQHRSTTSRASCRGRARAQRQPHLLSEPQPAAVLRGDGGPVRRAADTAAPCATSPRSSASTPSGWRAPAGLRPARRTAAPCASPAAPAQPLLRRPRRPAPRVVPRGRGASASRCRRGRGARRSTGTRAPAPRAGGTSRAAGCATRATCARSRWSTSRPSTSTPALPRERTIRRRAPRPGGRPATRPPPSGSTPRGGAAARAARHAFDADSGFFYDVRWRTGGRVLDRPTMAAAAPLYFGLATRSRGGRSRRGSGADFLRPGGFVTPWWPRGSMGRAQRVAAAPVARQRGRAPLRPRRPRRTRPAGRGGSPSTGGSTRRPAR